MPTSEQQPQSARAAADQEQAERHKTIAVRVQESVHSQLSFIAHLSGTSISQEIRQAIEGRISAAQRDADLIARAQQTRDQIEREAAARSAAITGFLGQKATAQAATKSAAPPGRRAAGTNGNHGKE
jgi:hypothetical protein